LADSLSSQLQMSDGDLRVSVTFQSTQVLCELGGELDIESGDLVADVVLALARDARQLTISLDRLGFCGAVGLRMLREIALIRQAAGHPVRIVGASSNVLDLLRWIGVPDHVELVGSTLATAGHSASAFDAGVHDLSAILPLAQLSHAIGALVSATVGVSVSIQRASQFHTIVTTAAAAADLDAVQYESANGPCVEALSTGQQVHERADGFDERWPRFAAAARRRRVLSVVSTPVPSLPDADAAAVNLYVGDDVVRPAMLHGLDQLASLASGLTRISHGSLDPRS